MADELDALLRHIVERYEGGYVDNPADRGGPTNFGITLATLAAWRRQPVKAADVAALGLEEALAIYRQRYVIAPGFDRIGDQAVRAYTIDFGINSGTARAALFLQAAAGVRQDGALGPVTLAAIAAAPAAVLRRMTHQRLIYLADLIRRKPQQAQFAVGWIRRATDWMGAAPAPIWGGAVA